MRLIRPAILLLLTLACPSLLGAGKNAAKNIAAPTMETILLLDNEEDFRARWHKTSEIVGYDQKRKAADIDSTSTGGELGGFKYNGKWEQVDLDLTIVNLNSTSPKARFSIFLGKRTQKPTAEFESVVTRPGTYHVRVVFEKEKALRIQVNNAVHPPIPVADPASMYPLQIEMHCPNGRGPNAFVGNVKIRAEPEADLTPPAVRAPITAKDVQLFTTEEDFRKRWKGAGANAAYDPKTKTIAVVNEAKVFDRSTGSFTYNGKWDEIEFDVALAEFKYPGWRLGFGVNLGHVSGYPSRSQEFRLDNPPTAPVNKGGAYRIKLVYQDGKSIAVYVNNKLAHTPVAVFDPATMAPLKVDLDSPVGFQIRNVKLKAETEK